MRDTEPGVLVVAATITVPDDLSTALVRGDTVTEVATALAGAALATKAHHDVTVLVAEVIR